MFAKFDYTCFPLIKVTFNKLENDAAFDVFLKEWLDIYERKQYFSIIFNTSEMDFINPKYAMRISGFIKTLKKMPIQYLLFSILIMNNKLLETLLKTVLSIQKPSAPLYITKCMEQSIEVYTKVIHGDKVLCPFFLPSVANATQ